MVQMSDVRKLFWIPPKTPAYLDYLFRRVSGLRDILKTNRGALCRSLIVDLSTGSLGGGGDDGAERRDGQLDGGGSDDGQQLNVPKAPLRRLSRSTMSLKIPPDIPEKPPHFQFFPPTPMAMGLNMPLTPTGDLNIPNGFSPQLYQAYTSNKATDFFFKQLDGNHILIAIITVTNFRLLFANYCWVPRFLQIIVEYLYFCKLLLSTSIFADYFWVPLFLQIIVEYLYFCKLLLSIY